jgi:hypothetical protein
MVSLARAAGVDARQAGAEELPFTDGLPAGAAVGSGRPRR